MSKCFVLPWKTGFLVITIVALSIQDILVSPLYFGQRSASSLLNHTTWYDIEVVIAYSTLNDNNIVVAFLFKHQEIAHHLRLKMLPKVLFLSSKNIPNHF